MIVPSSWLLWQSTKTFSSFPIYLASFLSETMNTALYLASSRKVLPPSRLVVEFYPKKNQGSKLGLGTHDCHSGRLRYRDLSQAHTKQTTRKEKWKQKTVGEGPGFRAQEASFISFSTYLFTFWHRISQCGPGWPWICDTPASDSQGLGFRCTLPCLATVPAFIFRSTWTGSSRDRKMTFLLCIHWIMF